MAKPVWPTIEAMLMMRPDCCLIRCGTTALVVRKTPRKLMSRTRSYSSSVRSWIGAGLGPNASVVDQDIDAAEFCKGFVDQIPGGLRLANVVLDGKVAGP